MKRGIVRLVDKMGRVVIPREFRKELNVENEKDKFEIFLEGDRIILKKYQSACTLCDRIGPSITYGEYTVCHECIEKLAAEKAKNENNA